MDYHHVPYYVIQQDLSVKEVPVVNSTDSGPQTIERKQPSFWNTAALFLEVAGEDGRLKYYAIGAVLAALYVFRE